MGTAADVIIVGLGAMGTSAAMHLAGRGARVLGFDRFEVPNAMGSSHGYTRMIRLCYYEHPDYVPLLLRAYELWQQLERDSQQKLLYLTGGLYIGRADSRFVSGSLASAREHHLPHEILEGAELSRRFPQFRVPRGFAGMYEPNAGILLPERIVAAQAQRAVAMGAKLHDREQVLRWEAGPQGVRVQTVRGTYQGGKLLLAAGAWNPVLAGRLGINLTVTRQPTAWFSPRRPEQFTMEKFPVWAFSGEDGTINYGFPILPDGQGGPGFKTAMHRPGEETDPEAIDRAPRAQDEEPLRAFLRAVIPDADGPMASMRVCMYTNTPDSHLLLDRHPEHDNVFVASPCSGHGFKFASVIGEALSDLMTAGSTRLPIDFLRAHRWAGKRSLIARGR